MSKMMSVSGDGELDHHKAAIILRGQHCGLLISKESSQNIKGFCPTIWDGAICWPKTPLNTTSIQKCPAIPGLDPNGTASKLCTSAGSWYFHTEKNSTWTDYTNCKISQSSISPSQLNESMIQEWLPVIKKISQVGYGVSFVTLLLAFFILVSIKKLRCPRNTLHMHLFLSFILRAFMAILKDLIFLQGVGLPNSIEENEGRIRFRHEQPNWECKLVTSLWQYFIVANYTWILMEGLYLHNLIFLAPFSDSSSIKHFIALGWGCPLLVVCSWVAVRATLDDTLCWTTNENQHLYLIIRIPIIISIVLNFVFFMNIVRVLLLKLQSAVSIETRKYRYRKWAKSTLVLMPLFGVHYMLFLWMSKYSHEDSIIEVIWLFCDQLFASFQGFFVSILYCLINGEVRSELGKKWSNWRSDGGGGESKNIWVPLNQISSKFYHRSTHDDLLHNNGSEFHPGNNSTCCPNPCIGNSSKNGKAHRVHHYQPSGAGGGHDDSANADTRKRGGGGYISPNSNSNYTLTQTEEHHLTINTEIPESPTSSVCHNDENVVSNSTAANYNKLLSSDISTSTTTNNGIQSEGPI